ncbi:hypothetical protein ACJX0J_019792, partial [Zea mays]
MIIWNTFFIFFSNTAHGVGLFRDIHNIVVVEAAYFHMHGYNSALMNQEKERDRGVVLPSANHQIAFATRGRLYNLVLENGPFSTIQKEVLYPPNDHWFFDRLQPITSKHKMKHKKTKPHLVWREHNLLTHESALDKPSHNNLNLQVLVYTKFYANFPTIYPVKKEEAKALL